MGMAKPPNSPKGVVKGKSSISSDTDLWTGLEQFKFDASESITINQQQRR